MAGKRTRTKQAAPKRSKASKEAEGGDAFFLGDSDDERAQPSGKKTLSEYQDQVEDEEARETVAEKRHRLAKQYLVQLQAGAEDDDRGGSRRGVTGGSDEDEDSQDDEGGQGAGLTGLDREQVAQLLHQEAAQAAGRGQQKLAHRISIPAIADASAAGLARRGHRLSATALALAHDDSACWTVSKDGALIRWDVETGVKTRLNKEPADDKGSKGAATAAGSGPDWVKRGARSGSTHALSAVAVSSDGALLAVGGGDRRVHVYDARTGGFVQAFPGHRDAITALAFREGSHTLLSGSLDRTVKLWSIDDRAYVDTLFGHQQEILALDILRAERAVSCGGDRSCRVWKIPEESQLIYKYSSPGSAQTLECCRLVTPTDWLTGSSDGSIQVWTQLKRKPVTVVTHAHGPLADKRGPVLTAGCIAHNSPLAVTDADAAAAPDITGWVQSVAVGRGSDLVASGAGDGCIRLWQVTQGKAGGISGLKQLGGLPARGWVNGLALSRTGRFVVAAMGQEPRLGRWARDGAAHNGLLLHRLEVE